MYTLERKCMIVEERLTYDTNVDTKGFEKGLEDIEKSLDKVMKKVISGITKVVKKISEIGKEAVKSYADLEQNMGNIETLFKSSSDKVIQNANNAYKTAGMSANDYMKTVTTFSTELLQSLGRDTEKTAEMVNIAIIDMADNANKMGTSMETIQSTYKEFAKQNYSMLDNLKLGYGRNSRRDATFA